MNNIVLPLKFDGKKYVSDIADGLLMSFGKKNFYLPYEIDKIHNRSKWKNILDSCWSICIFSTHKDFDRFYRMKEGYDYVIMREQILKTTFDLNKTDDYGLTEVVFDAISWIDFGDVFESVFEGIGDFIGGILGDL